MSVREFDESRFRAQVTASLKQLQEILDNSRAPKLPGDVPHEYDDKYGLAEFLGNTSIAAELECLRQLGLKPADLTLLHACAKDRSVTLRFDATEKCSYLRETSRKVESPSVVTESTLLGTSETKVVTTIVEHFWLFESQWTLSAFVGTGSEAGERVKLVERSGQCEIMTSSKTTPRVESRVVPPIDVRLTCLLNNVDAEMKPCFRITRNKLCRTPRRNPSVEQALTFQRELFTWGHDVYNYFISQLWTAQISATSRIDVRPFTEAAVFNPILALMEDGHKGKPVAEHLRTQPDEGPVPRASEVKEDEGAVVPARGSSVVSASASSSPLLPAGDFTTFTDAHKQILELRRQSMDQVFPGPAPDVGKLCSRVEAKLVLVCVHFQKLAQAYSDGVNYIEHLLRQQLIAAVGKELTAADFAAYMRFHQRKLYRAEYAPLPFSHAIRRPEHYPEGLMSIDSIGADGVSEPVPTLCRRVERAIPMHFALNAATNVTFRGQRFLHGLLQQSFGGASPASYTLTARAHQFSCFILLAGVIGSADLFQPKHAILLQNKDELSIPLLLEQMPSAAAFRDAIASLSPEQQRFAKAVRAMQLEGSLFGLLLLQVKPQLEKLLRLPDDALTKEIRLTQDLMQLFTKYQIPSDLLSYDGEESASVTSKVERVRAHADKIFAMIQSEKDAELAARQQEAAFALADRLARMPKPVPPPAPVVHSPPPMLPPVRKPVSHAPLPVKSSGPLSMLKSIFRKSEGAPPPSSPSAPSMLMMSDAPSMPVETQQCETRAMPSSPRSLPSAAPARLSPMPSRGLAAPSAPSADAPPTLQASSESAPARELSRDALPRKSKKMAPVDRKPVPVMSTGKPSSAKSIVSSIGGAPASSSASSSSSATPAAAKAHPSSVETGGEGVVVVNESEGEAIDWTALPGALDTKLLALDEDQALRATTIACGKTWTKRSAKSLLADASSTTLHEKEQTRAKNEAFDLLDALSRSGSLSFDSAELHIILACTHNFAQSLIDTVVQGNINPIEKMERSTLLLAGTIFGDKGPSELIKPEARERVATYSRGIFIEEAKQEKAAMLLKA